MRGKYEANIMKCEDQMDLKFCQLGQWFDGTQIKFVFSKPMSFGCLERKEKILNSYPIIRVHV